MVPGSLRLCLGASFLVATAGLIQPAAAQSDPKLGRAVLVTPAPQPVVVVPPNSNNPNGPAVVPVRPVEPLPILAAPQGGATAQPPGGSATPLTGGGQRGHFRLVAVEFDVIHQTRDDLIESDGPADEIQVRSDNFRYSRGGVFRGWEPRTSGIFGAADHADFLAGSALPALSARADYGGLKTGDFYPPDGRAIQTNGDLPFILWEGDLEMGGEGVVIAPSLWEIDGRDESDSQRTWNRTIEGRGRGNPLAFEMAFNTLIEDRDSPINDRLLPYLPVQDRGSRPLGAGAQVPFPAYIFALPLPIPFPGALPHASGTHLAAIPLTFERARYFASRAPAQVEIPGSGTPGRLRPVPAGGMVLRLTDRPEMEGDYLLIMRLEQVN